MSLAEQFKRGLVNCLPEEDTVRPIVGTYRTKSLILATRHVTSIPSQLYKKNLLVCTASIKYTYPFARECNTHI